MSEKNADQLGGAVDVPPPKDIQNVAYSGPIELSPTETGLNQPELHVLSLPANENLNGVTGIYMTETRDGKRVYVGHVVYSVAYDTPNIAGVSVNFCKTKGFREKLGDVPADVASLIDNGIISNAVEVGLPYRNQKLGGALWLSALKIMGDHGVESVSISGDMTIGKKDSESSFYTKYGSVPGKFGNQVVKISDVFTKFSNTIHQLFGM